MRRSPSVTMLSASQRGSRGSLAPNSSNSTSALPTLDPNPYTDTPSGKQRSLPLIISVIVIVMIFAVPTIVGYNRAATELDVERGDYRHPPLIAKDYRLWNIAAITDLDKNSKQDGGKSYVANMKRGQLKKDANGYFDVVWSADEKLKSGHNEGGRGMELSELIDFQGKLYTMDDRSGIVFEAIREDTGDWHVAPKWILGEGDGSHDKGMKIEWAAIKDGEMVLGSFGKEYTAEDGSVISMNNNWVCFIDGEGRVRREDWTALYNAIRRKVGAVFPGYVVHEAGAWSQRLKQWVFLPRRVSDQPYNDMLDERKGSNLLVTVDPKGLKVEAREVGTLTPERGFSTFKFVPGTEEKVIVAIKSEESEAAGTQDSYITVFTIDGKVSASQGTDDVHRSSLESHSPNPANQPASH
ncbi:unnamed protein product [Chrysoparadoxa australica]